MLRIAIFLLPLLVPCASDKPLFARKAFLGKDGKISIRDMPTKPGNPTSSRITGESKQAASEAEYPWMAAMTFDDGAGTQWFCGGSIVDFEWILTAAHCLIDAASVEILVGVNNRITDTDGVLYTNETNFFPHENFTLTPDMANDIALIKLSSPLEFTRQIMSVNLPSEPFNEYDPRFPTGWGLITDDALILNEALMETLTAGLSHEECVSYYGSAVTDGVICTWYGTGWGNGACTGDDGGPMNLNSVSYGVISFYAEGNCEGDLPTAYADTYYYKQWIISTVNNITII